MFEHFTEAARGVVVNAQEQARTLGHSEILAEHVLLGVMSDTEGIGARVLRDLGVDADALVSEVAALGDADAEALRSIGVDLLAVRRQAEAAFGSGALDRPRRRRVGLFRKHVVLVGGPLDFANTATRSLEQAVRQVQAFNHGYIGSEHTSSWACSSSGNRTRQRVFYGGWALRRPQFANGSSTSCCAHLTSVVRRRGMPSSWPH
jgi:ATP-dependent Clp protease ATP-binding subunit ClpA